MFLIDTLMIYLIGVLFEPGERKYRSCARNGVYQHVREQKSHTFHKNQQQKYDFSQTN
ncbi:MULTISPECIES: hypothetical protein [unclassified Fibrobacter]|uniref:hypothetical protein n=1 Tax=unclassified Fibrobacter TaxID=2634177 RepID=UPI001304D16C|nr:MULTISPECIES: hypothetical protein [unclassified Fibrobacter]